MSINIGFFKHNEYVITIKINDDIKQYNSNDIFDHYYASYITNNFSVIKIEHMFTKKLINKITNISINNDFATYHSFYEVNKTYYESKIYYLSYDRAYYKDFVHKFQWNIYNNLNNHNYFGIFKDWFDNGQLQSQYWHINGIKEGVYKEYDINGNMIKNIYYENTDNDTNYNKLDQLNKENCNYKLLSGNLLSVPLI